MEVNLTHPLVRFVLSLKHSPKTNFKKGTINNQDAIILFIHAHGMLGLKEIRQLSFVWKGTRPAGKWYPAAPNWSLQSYFGPTHGYTAKYFRGGEIYHEGFLSSGGNRKPPPFFRIIHHSKGQRYKNALSWDGVIRLGYLLTQIEL